MSGSEERAGLPGDDDVGEADDDDELEVWEEEDELKGFGKPMAPVSALKERRRV